MKVIKLAKSIQEEYGIRNLSLAGGVALNSVAMEKFLKKNF